MVEKKVEEEKTQLAQASGVFDNLGGVGEFYLPNQAAAGLGIEKLIIPKAYHKVIEMCYDFYQRGGIVTTVINRLTELAITDIENGQRKTTDEANEYFDVVLHRKPSFLNRFIHTAALEYFLSGMVLPRIDWEEKLGEELSPKLRPSKKYIVPVFDLYPPQLVKIAWVGWGKKEFYLEIPEKDLRLIKNSGGTIKNQQQRARYDMWVSEYPLIVDQVKSNKKMIKLDVDPILRKEVSISEYPTPYLFNILEALVFKQQLRRMDFAVASRVVSAIMLVQEGDADFPITEETRGNLDELKKQIQMRTGDPRQQERLFMLFTNHTTKISWITPDVAALLDQDKYRQTNDEIAEGLGFAKILLTGESRNSQASEVSTWAIQPMLEELRSFLLEMMIPIYEQAADLNGFRNVPVPTFSPIRLQDAIKTAAVFAQLFKEGNISRSTRDQMAGLKFESELEQMKDEKDLIKELGGEFGEMPYDITDPRKAKTPANGGAGRPAGAPKGGRPIGSQNPAVNKRNRGVKPAGQSPVSRVAAEKINLLNDDEFIDLATQVMEERGIILGVEDI